MHMHMRMPCNIITLHHCCRSLSSLKSLVATRHSPLHGCGAHRGPTLITTQHPPPPPPPLGLSALIFNFFICFASCPWEMYSLGALYREASRT